MADVKPDGELAQLSRRIHELEETNNKLSVLLETTRLLSAEISLKSLLRLVMREVSRVLDADRSSLFLLDRTTHELWSLVAQGMHDAELRFPTTRGIAGYVARTGEIVNIQDAYQDERFNPEIDRGTGFRTTSLLAVPLQDRAGKVIGVIQTLNKRPHGPFNEQDIDLLTALAAQASISIENALLYERIEGLFKGFVDTIVYAIDARDPTTSGHSHRVAAYSVNLATACSDWDRGVLADVKFSAEHLNAVRLASLLHDVGKIGVREQVLCKRYTLLLPELALVDERIRRAKVERELESWKGGKPPRPEELAFYLSLAEVVTRRRIPAPLAEGEAQLLERAHRERLLTDRQYQCFLLTRGNLVNTEWDDMASHVSRSYELLRKIPWPEPLARIPEIAWSHHEKLDGSGYPRGLVGDEFPFEGRILAIADIYDALTSSDRPYKRAYTPTEARAILGEEVQSGHVDADLFEVFFAADCTQLPAEIPQPPPEPPPEPEL